MFISSRRIYGFLSQSSDAFNVSLPWQTSVQDGLFAMNYDIISAVTDNLVMWANTNWGDRPMRFRFGLDARRYLFEQETEAKEAIKQNAQEQLSQYFPFLQIINLDVKTTSDDDTLRSNSIRFILKASLEDSPYRTIDINEVIGR